MHTLTTNICYAHADIHILSTFLRFCLAVVFPFTSFFFFILCMCFPYSINGTSKNKERKKNTKNGPEVH